MNSSSVNWAFTGRYCGIGKAVANEAVVNYCELVTTPPMLEDRFARRVKNGGKKIGNSFGE